MSGLFVVVFLFPFVCFFLFPFVFLFYFELFILKKQTKNSAEIMLCGKIFAEFFLSLPTSAKQQNPTT